jgi:uncharacterized membrane protein (UPF0127 family)
MAVLCRLSYSSQIIDDSGSMRRMSPLLLVALLLSGCGDEPARTPATSGAAPTPTVSAGEFGTASVEIETSAGPVTLSVQVASTPDARNRGLMGRTSLEPFDGMVFLFPDERPRSFWMKDTLIPLSIAFFDSDGVIVSIVDMRPCEADPCTYYSSGAPAAGALEVARGYLAERGIAVGDRVSVLDVTPDRSPE